MKILQVTQRFNPSISGSQYHVYRISKELIKRGHDVSVVTTTSMHNKDIRGFSTSRPFSLRSNDPDLPKKELLDGISVYRFQPVLQFWMYMINPLMFIHLLRNINRYDIVHGHVYMGAESSMAAKACRMRNVPYVFTAHDLVSNQGSCMNYLKNFYDRTDGAITLNLANRVIALTNENKKQYKILGLDDDKIRVVPNGVDFEKFYNKRRSHKSSDKLPAKKQLVLFVGRLVRYKGAQYIVMAILDIIGTYPNTEFVFIGEDQGYKEELIQLAKSFGVLDRCIFRGKVKDSELLYYYSIADVFLLPSIGEGFGLVALEAMASGVPVILANVGGLKHILSEIGGYPLDMTKDIPKQISNYIKEIFSNPNPEIEIEKEQKILKSSYSWERVAEMLEDIYLEASV
jgi:glycosyltransferase involved in cell wall biosynthesis